MILVLLGTALAQSPVQTAGVSASLLAFQGPARHLTQPMVGGWVSVGPRPWSVSGEVDVTWRSRANTFYAIRNIGFRASALADLALGTQAFTFRAGIGPGMLLTDTAVDTSTSTTLLVVEPAMRVRVQVDGPIPKTPLALRWSLGTFVRGGLAADFDTSLGLGVHW